jgi:hypothetical protein
MWSAKGFPPGSKAGREREGLFSIETSRYAPRIFHWPEEGGGD